MLYLLSTVAVRAERPSACTFPFLLRDNPAGGLPEPVSVVPARYSVRHPVHPRLDARYVECGGGGSHFHMRPPASVISETTAEQLFCPRITCRGQEVRLISPYRTVLLGFVSRCSVRLLSALNSSTYTLAFITQLAPCWLPVLTVGDREPVTRGCVRVNLTQEPCPGIRRRCVPNVCFT